MVGDTWKIITDESLIKVVIEHFRSQILATSKTERNHSLIDIIEETIKKSQSSVVGFVLPQDSESSEISFPSYAVRLIYPICRSNTVPTLQQMCLSKIKSKVNQSNINSLPLPTKIKEFVHENYNTLWIFTLFTVTFYPKKAINFSFYTPKNQRYVEIIGNGEIIPAHHRFYFEETPWWIFMIVLWSKCSKNLEN